MFRDWAADAPDEASMLAAVITGPPEPFVPPELVGQKAVAILGCWCGDLDAGTEAIEPLRALSPSATFSLRCRMSRSGNAGWQRGPGPTQLLPWWLRRRPRRRDHRHRARTRRPHALADVTDPLSIRWAVRSDESGAAPPHSAAGAPPIPTTSSRPGPTRPRTSAARGPSAAADLAAPERRRYLLAELLVCAVCGRQMESAWSERESRLPVPPRSQQRCQTRPGPGETPTSARIASCRTCLPCTCCSRERPPGAEGGPPEPGST